MINFYIRCNWISDCFWCMDFQPGSKVNNNNLISRCFNEHIFSETSLALGCVKNGTRCKDKILPLEKEKRIIFSKE